MEVHHHSHAHGKKTWKSYFWEFLMLFLAVFCGFLAEYQLEHKIEKDREKQYIRSMVEDLKADTAMLAANIRLRDIRIGMTDSFVALLSSPAPDERGSDLYHYARNVSPPANIFSNDGTIQQLKSAGNLRLIRKKEVVKHLMDYDQRIRQYSYEMGDEVEIRAAYRQCVISLFDTKVFYEIGKEEEIGRPAGNPKMLSKDPARINELIGHIQYLRRIHQVQRARSIQLLEQATNLLNLINNAYHLN